MITRHRPLRRAVASLLLAVFVVATTGVKPSAQPRIPDPFKGAAVLAGLGAIGAQVKEAIEKAIGGGLILEIQAGAQIALAIDQAKTAFEHEANLFWRDLNATQQSIIGSITSPAFEFIDKTYADITEVQKRAQAAIHDLPFTKNFPQAWTFTPIYAEALPDEMIRAAIEGDFYDLARKDYDATLEINSHTYSTSEKSSAGMAFRVPATDLQPAGSRPVENKLTVKVPYRKPFLLFFWKKDVATFQTRIVTLPKNLGTLTIAITTSQPGVTRQNVVRPTDPQESYGDDIKCGGEHADKALHYGYPDSNWRVLPYTVTWNVLWSQGRQGVGQDWWLDQNCSTPLIACLCVSTVHHGFGTSGKVHFNIVFTEEKDVVNTETNRTVVDIGWGESRVVEIPPVGATWTGTYRRFDGKTFMFAGPYRDSYIWVKQTANLITVATAPYNSTIDLGVMTKAIATATRPAK